MKIVSWNVNGIRSMLTKGFIDIIHDLQPDILCLQETKAGKDAIEIDLKGYCQYWSSAKKLGYSGTAIFTKVKPLKVNFGLLNEVHDQEGRVITAEYAQFYLVNVYVPNSKRDLSRLEYRSQQWDVDFLAYLVNLERSKPVIFCGDLNVAHQEIDLSFPKANANSHGFTPEERSGLEKILQAGFIDTFRVFEKNGGHYTWWSPFSNCRQRNIGWRIDYFLISKALKPALKSSSILPHIKGSDHCPIALEIADLGP